MTNAITEVNGKFYKKCKVVMLPTDKIVLYGIGIIIKNQYGKTKEGDTDFSNIISHKGDLEFINKDPDNVSYHYLQLQHLYFLSDEEIKKGDWGFDIEKNDTFKAGNTFLVKELWEKGLIKKIIASTDESLRWNNDNLIQVIDIHFCQYPRPSNDFLKAYCEQEGIDEVLVEYIREIKMVGGLETYNSMKDLILKVAPDNTITTKRIKDSWNRQEVKQKMKDSIAYALIKPNDNLAEISEWINNHL